MVERTDPAPGIDVLVDGVKALTGSVKDLTARSRRNRLLIGVTAIGLMLDLALSGLFLYQHEQQDCQNRLAESLFHAETAKVSGQIKGIDMVLKDPAAGVAQFRAASSQYLLVIKRLNDHQC